MFILIPAGHFGKAVIRELAGNIVLIDSLKQSIQFFITGLQSCKLFFFEPAVQSNILLGAAHNSLDEIILIPAGKLGQALDLT